MNITTEKAVADYVAGLRTLFGINTTTIVVWGQDRAQSLLYDPYADTAILHLSEVIFIGDTAGFYRSLIGLVASIMTKRIQHLWDLFECNKIEKTQFHFGLFQLTGKFASNMALLVYKTTTPT